MKESLLKLWAWLGAHWDTVLSVLGVVGYLWLNARNARTAVEKRAGSKAVALIDRIAVVTMRGARNRVSAPVLGQSIADEAREATSESDPPPASPGFSETAVLGIVAAVAFVALIGLALTSCSGSSALRRAVEPIALSEIDHPRHGRCHEVGARARSATLNRELVLYAGVCLGTIDGGVAADAAVSE